MASFHWSEDRSIVPLNVLKGFWVEAFAQLRWKERRRKKHGQTGFLHPFREDFGENKKSLLRLWTWKKQQTIAKLFFRLNTLIIHSAKMAGFQANNKAADVILSENHHGQSELMNYTKPLTKQVALLQWSASFSGEIKKPCGKTFLISTILFSDGVSYCFNKS